MNAGQGTTVVKAGTELAQKAGEINAELGQSVGEAAQAARAIAASTHQQNAGMDQIAQAKSETSQNTTQFVTGAQETQSAIGGCRSSRVSSRISPGTSSCRATTGRARCIRRPSRSPTSPSPRPAGDAPGEPMIRRCPSATTSSGGRPSCSSG